MRYQFFNSEMNLVFGQTEINHGYGGDPAVIRVAAREEGAGLNGFACSHLTDVTNPTKTVKFDWVKSDGTGVAGSYSDSNWS